MTTPTTEPTPPKSRGELEARQLAQVAEMADASLRDHIITPLLDAGEFRAWRCGREQCAAYHFDVYVVPGRLMVFGDMGCLVVERTRDMIAWSRSAIRSLGYFASKVPEELRGSVREYDEEVVQAWVAEQDAEATGEGCWTAKLRKKVLDAASQGAESVADVLWTSDYIDGCDYPDFTRWTFSFLWKVEALKWLLARL